MQKFEFLRQPLMGELAMSRKKVERKRKNAICGGHLRLCQQPRAAHALRSNQNLECDEACWYSWHRFDWLPKGPSICLVLSLYITNYKFEHPFMYFLPSNSWNKYSKLAFLGNQECKGNDEYLMIQNTRFLSWLPSYRQINCVMLNLKLSNLKNYIWHFKI